jgi:hypothetical protein
MTTLKQIQLAKENGDNSGYKYQLAQVLATAEKLEEAEREVAMWAKYFRKASDLITELTDLELWHSDDNNTYHWCKTSPGHDTPSIDYPSRAAAIRALIDDKIVWL